MVWQWQLSTKETIREHTRDQIKVSIEDKHGTHQEVSNETYEEDQRKDKKSHSKGYSQDSCPKKLIKHHVHQV